MMGPMRIGQLAHETGVSTKTVRYYETIGVLPEPDRASNGYRTYDQGSIERLRFIRNAQATGLTLTAITSILELREQGASTCRHVTRLLEHRLDDLDQHITALQSTRTQLAALTERARNLDPADCTDPSRCQTISTGIDAFGGPSKIRSASHRHHH